MKIEELEKGDYDTFVQWLGSKIKVECHGIIKFVAEILLKLYQNIVLITMLSSIPLGMLAVVLNSTNLMLSCIIVFIFCSLIYGYGNLKQQYNAYIEKKARSIRERDEKNRKIASLLRQQQRNPSRYYPYPHPPIVPPKKPKSS